MTAASLATRLYSRNREHLVGSRRLLRRSPPVVSLERHGGHGESRLVWRSLLSRRVAISPPAIPSQIRDDPVVSYKCLRVPA